MKKYLRILFIVVCSATMFILLFLGGIYLNTKSAINETYAPMEGKKKDDQNINNIKPLVILLLGTDTGDFNRTDSGRTDTMIISVLNPKKETTTLISIPRDTLTDIYGIEIQDKINHAYAYGGIAATIPTVENFLNLSIDYYIEINLLGIQELVNTIGDIEVNNKFSFSYEGSYFPIGKLKLNGEEALKYSRMRYDDPNGDYGRQERQREVLISIIDKMRSINSIVRYKDILDTIKSNLKTNLTWDNIEKLTLNYRKSLKTIDTDQIKGESFVGDGETGEQGISYQKISNSEISRIKKILETQLE